MLPFIVGQLADALTMHPSSELNSLALGPFALAEKALMIAAVCLIAYALSRGRYAWVRRPLLWVGTLVGVIGAVSNL